MEIGVSKLMHMYSLSKLASSSFLNPLATLCFVFGMASTMPLVAIGLGGANISLYDFSSILIVTSLYGFHIVRGHRLLPVYTTKYIFLFLFSGISGAVVGYIFAFDKLEWQLAAISYLPKILFYSLLVFAFQFKFNRDKYLAALINGVLFGFVLNAVWSILEGLYFYNSGELLNDHVFSGYADRLEGRGGMTVLSDGIIRSSGFNTDPAHIGFIVPALFFYGLAKRNPLLILISLVSLVFSGSTTAIVSVILISIICRKNIFRKSQAGHGKGFLIKFLIIIIFSVSLMLFIDLGGLFDNLLGFVERIGSLYLNSQYSGPRGFYHTNIFDAAAAAGGFLFTGTGMGTGSFFYLNIPGVSLPDGVDFFPYDPESTYISYLFDIGVFGLTFYILALYNALSRLGRSPCSGDCSILVYFGLLSILTTNFFYHYILTSTQFILIMSATLLSWRSVYAPR